MTDHGPLVDADFVDMQDVDTARPYTKARARKVTEMIKRDLIGVWQLIAEAYKGRIWIPLGYSNWDEYCTEEFCTSRLRLPREDRAEVVASLRESGFSVRAIASATGIDKNTVQSDLAKVSEIHTPKSGDVIDAEVITDPRPVTGLDGKTYQPKPQRRKRRANDAGEISQESSDRPGATRYSKAIQDCSATMVDAYEALTDEQLAEALGAAQWLYELLRGETILRQDRRA